MNVENIIALGVGIISFILFIRDISPIIATRNWLRVEGKIISSEIFEIKIGAGSPTDAGTRRIIRPSIKFSYTVNGELFHSNTYRPQTKSHGIESGTFLYFLPYMDRRYARKKIEEYYVNRQVNVFYDPNDANNAVLERKIPFSMFWWLIIAAPFTFFGLLGISS